ELVASNAGVVDEDIDLSKLRERCLHAGLDLVFAGNVHGEAGGLRTGGTDVVSNRGQLLLVARGESHGGSGARQLQRAGAPNALGCSGDQGHTAGEVRHLQAPRTERRTIASGLS